MICEVIANFYVTLYLLVMSASKPQKKSLPNQSSVQSQMASGASPAGGSSSPRKVFINHSPSDPTPTTTPAASTTSTHPKTHLNTKVASKDGKNQQQINCMSKW